MPQPKDQPKDQPKGQPKDRQGSNDADRALDALRGGVHHGTGGSNRHGAVSSDLSVDEAILVDQAGYEPRGLVMGTCIFRPYTFGSWAPMSQSTELTAMSSAMHDSRNIAMRRLRSQAARVGGEGVVGVRLSVESSAREFRFSAVGTAVTHRVGRHRGNEAQSPNEIFTSDLSGKDFALLNAAGYGVLGLVMGVCVYHVARQSASTWMKNQNQNVELPLITSALYDSRELAMGRMQDDALSVGAQGVVGVKVEERTHAWGTHIIEFLAIGTAVASLDGTHRTLSPKLAVELEDRAQGVDPHALRGDT
jgi:uncharacterized protein YbjQ (UPF0145 family)